MITLSNVYFAYDNENVLQNINLTWNKNESIYIWGPNGGGKTTLAYIIAGILSPNSGNINKTNLKDTDILLLMQNPTDMVFTNSVITELAFGLENLGLPRNEIHKRVYWACKTFSLDHLAFESPHNLSGGELSLVVLASLIVMHPQYLILDEPFAHLDWFGRNTVIDAINNMKDKLNLAVLELGLTNNPTLSSSRKYYINKTLTENTPEESHPSIALKFPQPGDWVANLSDVSFVYKGRKQKAVSGIELKVNEGEAIGIVGPNGAGKTTLGKLIAGVLKPVQGKIKVKGRAGYLFQFPERQFFKENVLADVSAGPIALGLDNPTERAKTALNLVGVPSSDWQKSPFKLNTGKLRRIAFASILAIDPSIIILDEPFADLDQNGKIEIATILENLLNQGKSYIILSSNLLNLIGLVNRVIILKGGSIEWDGKIDEMPYSHRDIRELGIII